MENIRLCERAYIESFSKTLHENDFMEFYDNLIKDMYDHNFIYLPKIIKEENAIAIINERLIQAQETGFSKVVFGMDYKSKEIEEILKKTIKKMEIEKYGCYLLDISKVETWKKREDCTIKKITSKQDIKDAINMSIKMDGEILGEDFCTRRINRKAQVYTENKNIDKYLIYHNNELVGHCEAFIKDDDAKLEDLCVLPEYRKMGFATTLLKYIVKEVRGKDVKTIFLNTDEDDTVKEMYMKLGFSKISENYALLWANWME